MNENELRGILGTNLKRYRCFRGLSQAKLAEIVDISPNFISDIETGKRWLSSDTLVNLAGALNIDVYEFLKPETIVPDDITAFIAKYTEEAASILTTLVAQSLERLRKQYLPESE
ncbi:MAG: helix-turn-helix domain-containing protein [Treponema sp.]|jgi:transcriptional regulator with XRE-family HTH domain|nr:helix-turn-helix domain-containing protein [Treponema sp.]